MKIPNIERRTEQDTISIIAERSKSYTPEWRFDRSKIEAGTALALIYSDMYSDTVKKYNQLVRKNMFEFFNCAGACLMTAQPAGGYIVFNLVNREAAGTEVKKGTKLLAETGLEEELLFETRNDVYVTPAALLDLYQVRPYRDEIIHLYGSLRGTDQEPVPEFRLYQSKGKNLQSHELYLSHDVIFHMGQEECIELQLHPVPNHPISEQMRKLLGDSSMISYEYSTEEGYEPFIRAEEQNGTLFLYKEKQQPESGTQEIDGKRGYWIRCRIQDINAFAGLSFNEITVGSRKKDISPEIIFAGALEQETREFLPFGEQMGVYEEVYFASSQVLSKKGAVICLEFHVDFMAIPTESSKQQPGVDWRLVMRRSDFIPDPEYDIGIDEVCWEYFNGNDWKKLTESKRYEKVFTPSQNPRGNRAGITFQCPGDLEPILVHAIHSHYIRARIIRMHNQYQPKGRYLPPVLSDVSFSCWYEEPRPRPETLVCSNNLNHFLRMQPVYRPFEKLEENRDTLYLGFDRPFSRGPIRLLVQMKDPVRNQSGPLRYEYYGREKWCLLNVVDSTDNLSKTGIMTFLGAPDFSQKTMWGKARYWIRISSATAAADSIQPVICGLHMNAAEILAVETKEPEYFYIEPNQKHAAFQLTGKNVYEMHVWVKELQNGPGGEVWTQWQEVDSFAASGPDDCHYIADKNNGSFRFSDGKHGRIPNSAMEDTIRVCYQCGGGSQGNLPPGTVNRLRMSAGYINRITNPQATSGGTDQEQADDAVIRTARSFRHRGKAVTADDYEALVMESAQNISRVTCFLNCGEQGEAASGHIGIAVLLDNPCQNRNSFADLRNRILEYMKGKVPDSLIEHGHLHVIEPELVTLSVKAVIIVEDSHDIFEKRQNTLDRLEEFLDPIHGNFHKQGWEIGEMPSQIQIMNIIRSIPGIQAVDGFRLSGTVQHNGIRKEIDLTNLKRSRFSVPVNGEHEIEILTGGGSR